MQRHAQRLGRAVRIDDELGVDEDRRRRHGQRELVTVAVEDRPATRLQDRLLRALVRAGDLVLRATSRLQHGDAYQDPSEDQDRNDEQHDQPAAWLP